MKLKARPDAIMQMIGEAVAHLPNATVAFYTLVAANPEARPALAEKLHQVEASSDESYLILMRKVVKTFITPYDREDIYSMIESLDDVIDLLDHTGYLIVDLEMGKLPDELVNNAKVLSEMAELARESVGLIKKSGKLEKLLFAMSDLEGTLDVGHRQILVGALRDGADPIEAQRTILIADLLEEAATGLERFIRTLSVAAVKET